MKTCNILSTVATVVATAMATVPEESNPLLQDWSSEPFSLPPFQKIESSHFREAFEFGMGEHLFELQTIVNKTDEPTFENTIATYDRSGSLLKKISSLFHNMIRSLNTDEMKQVETYLKPILSRHYSNVYTLDGLFQRIDIIHERRDHLKLTSEERRLVETLHDEFILQGANFTENEKEEYARVKAKLSSLQTEFSQNILKDEETYEIVLSKEDMDGCPDYLVEAAAYAAMERNKSVGEYVITLSGSMITPFLKYANRKDLREKVWRARSQRGELSADRDNLPIAVEILKLRNRQAVMHGYKSFAEYQLKNRMAKSPDNVMKLLEKVWEIAKGRAIKEIEVLEDYCKENGVDLGDEGILPWDWIYYAEKFRLAKYDIDESMIRPYLSLDKITQSVMGVSNKLFGLQYLERADIVSYHPDVKTYEVRDASHKLVAIYMTDNYARKYKYSGAWNSKYRVQAKNLSPGSADIEGVPIISNNNNLAKGIPPTLLSFRDAKTLYHEMGHAHHDILSNATYLYLAGTRVPTDWVELPSSLMENWLEQPEVLKEYATHYKTNESMTDDMFSKLKAAQNLNQGYNTARYTMSALLDMTVHQMENYDDFNITKFELEELKRLGMPKSIIMRHRPAHFKHIFGGSRYAAGYYVYMWAWVLASDVFAAFEETGNIFDLKTATRAKRYIYSSGNTADPDELFRMFRGRDPDVQFMLEKRGLVP